MSDKKEICIIECISSGMMYLEEIIDRGYKALLIQPICDDAHMMEIKHAAVDSFLRSHGTEDFEYMFVENNSDAMVEAIKDHIDNIVAVVCGSEMGVRPADEVAAKLGLVGNNPDTSNSRCTKKGMIKALESAGIRAIKTVVVNSDEDIIHFFRDNNINKAFMKFSESAGGYANKTCENMQEALDYYQHIKNIPNYFGNNKDEILLQEFIEGNEYVVNTMSCQGKHILTDIWQYTKTPNDKGSVLYNSSKLIEELDDELQSLVEYVFKVLDAVNLTVGPCHGEYKIDQNGPVLIETNCRPMGDSTTRDYMLDISGNCIVDWSLDAYLKQDDFLERIAQNKPYKTIQSASKKYGILNKEREGDMSAAFCIGEHLKTYHNHNDYQPAGIKKYPKTEDLGDTPMILKLAGSSAEDVKYDIDLMRKFETTYPDIYVCPKPNLDAGSISDINEIASALGSYDAVIDRADACTRTLVITEDNAYEVCKGKYSPVDCNTPKIFDQVLYANASQATLAQKFNEIFDSFKYLKVGGRALCGKNVTSILPYGEECFDLIKAAARVK